MLTLVLTRHGLTTRSHPEQHLGLKIDVPLSDDGRMQATALAARLAPIAFDRIISSPLLRALETAQAIREAPCEVPRPPTETDPRVLEMDYGGWEGLTYEEINATDAARRGRWEANPADIACPGGESGNDVARRVGDVLAELLAGRADTRVLLVAHSTLNRILICLALAIPIREFRNRVVQSQVNLTALEWSTGAAPAEARLLLLNDVAHVRQPPQVPWE